MAQQDHHGVPCDANWAVVLGGSSRASSIHGTQRYGIERGEQAREAEKGDLVIHGRHGTDSGLGHLRR